MNKQGLLNAALFFSFFAFTTVYAWNAHAALDTKFLANGSVVSAEQAFKAAQSGQTVYECKSQELSVSKSGKGLALKTAKKSKTKEQVEKAIEELKKQQE